MQVPVANVQHAATAQQAACETATGSSRPTSGDQRLAAAQQTQRAVIGGMQVPLANAQHAATAQQAVCATASSTADQRQAQSAAARMAAGLGHTKAAAQA